MMYYFFLIFVSMSLLTGALNATELQSFKGCKLVDAAWADGDSFPVRFPDGSEHTIRLYGADCLEANVNDTTDARRLRAQRRYFGISDYGDSPRSSIELAKSVGVEAKTQVRQILEQPFTVHTAFADGGGSGHYKRFYAFVATATGEDLATLLVERGLAEDAVTCFDNAIRLGYRSAGVLEEKARALEEAGEHEQAEEVADRAEEIRREAEGQMVEEQTGQAPGPGGRDRRGGQPGGRGEPAEPPERELQGEGPEGF
jgi:endonuclease YncB( thermonuclease family)